MSTLPTLDGRFMQMSGIYFKYDSSLPSGQRVLRDSIEIMGGTFDTEATYRVSTISYLAKIGGDGY